MIQSHVSCRLNDNKLYDHNAEIDVKYALVPTYFSCFWIPFGYRFFELHKRYKVTENMSIMMHSFDPGTNIGIGIIYLHNP